jgi:signal transduction histidine kinase
MRSLGGKLDIESAPGLGTIVVAWVPIPKLAS